MFRYASFLDENPQNQSFKIDVEKNICKVYIDPAFSAPVCHVVVHQKKYKNIPCLIDTLYKVARNEYDSASPNVLRKNAERQNKRLDGIKEILKKSIEMEQNFDKSLQKMLKDDNLGEYVNEKMKDEYHAEKARQKRFFRKFGMNRKRFNWFFTVTMDSSIFSSEEDWWEKLSRRFANISDKYDVKIMGGIEFGEANGRIHFHGIAYFPEDFWDGDLYEVTRYSEKDKCWKKMLESKEFRDKFGINEFERLDTTSDKECIRICNYVVKYAVKQGGKMYYSRGLPDCFYQNICYDDLFYVFEDGQMKFVFRPDANIFESAYLKDCFGRRIGRRVSNVELPFACS